MNFSLFLCYFIIHCVCSLFACVYGHLCVLVCMHVCICLCVFMSCTFVILCTSMYVYMFFCVHLCVFFCVYAYVHTCTWMPQYIWRGKNTAQQDNHTSLCEPGIKIREWGLMAYTFTYWVFCCPIRCLLSKWYKWINIITKPHTHHI